MARFIDRKPWGYFGMPLRNAFRSSFWIGAAIGLGGLALQLEIMHVCGWFDYGTVQLHFGELVVYGVMWALVFLCVGINEEGTLRGYVQRVTTDGLSMLPRSWSFWTSAVLFSILFAAAHLTNPGENPDARCAISIRNWLLQSAGHWVRRRDLDRGISAYRFGPGVFNRCLNNLAFNGEIELAPKGLMVRFIADDPADNC